jgi:hypothetical protein
MTEKIIFANSWQDFFAELGFSSFDDFFNYPAKEMSKNSRRNIAPLTLGHDPDRKAFFLKRFRNPHFKDVVSAWRIFGRPTSQAAVEWANANLLSRCGVRTYRPVCLGEQTRFGIEKKSFLITEKLGSPCLTDFIARNFLRLAQSQKEKIIISLAKLIRKIHDARISLPDLYVWHIFVEESKDAGKWDFAVIDLHRMAHNVTDKNQQIRNLGRLDYSMLDKYFDDKLRQLFIESYAGDDWPGGAACLAAKVKKYSNKISSRKKPKQY